MNMALFVTLFSIDIHLDGFQVLNVMNKAAIYILVQLFMWTHPFISLACVNLDIEDLDMA